MNELQQIQGAWLLLNPKGKSTHWDIDEDSITEAGPDSSDHKPTRRIAIDADSNRITLTTFKGLKIEKGFYRLKGDSLQICLGNDDESNPIKSDAPSYFELSRCETRPAFLAYRPAPITHDVLGTLTWDRKDNWWTAAVPSSLVHGKRICISPEPDLQTNIRLASAFSTWLPKNYDTFIESAASEAFNYDLVWTDVSPTELAAALKINGVNIYDGFLRVWLDAGGATTDHLIQTVLDESHTIVSMEI